MSGMDRGLVLLARSMLDQLHIAMDIRSVDDLNSLVFALIYEGLCGEHIPDLVRNPRSAEDEVHNCQLVIDALSMDILHTSLSHITGEDLATGDRLAMSNLLEIFSGLMEYILNKIDSDISSTDDDAGADIEDDPDAMTPDEIDDILERELRRPPHQYRETGRSVGPSLSGRSSRSQAPASWDDLQDGKLESTASLIREGEMLERQGLTAERGLRPSSESQAKTGDGRRGQQRDRTPPLRDHPVSRLVTLPSQHPGLADTAQDVTPELSPPKRQATAHAFDNIGVRISRPETSASVGVDGHPGNKVKHLLTEAQPSTDTDRTHRTYTHHLYHHYSQPAPVAGPANITNRSAAPVSATVVSEVQQNRSFDRLKAEVERTVQMSRDAVSPDRGRAQADQPKSTTSRSKSPSLPVSAIAPPSSDSGAGRDTTKAVSSLVKEEQLLSANIRDRLSRIESESTEIHQLAASLNLPARAQPDVAPFSRSAGPSAQPDNDPQGLAARKVCFRVEPETVQQADKPAPVDQRYLKRRYPPTKAAVSGRGGRTRGGKIPVRTRLAGKTVPVARRGYSSDGDVDDGCDLLSSPEISPERYKQRYRALLLEDLEARARRRPGLKPHTAVTNPLRRKAGDPLRETQIHINAEDNKARQKTQYLRLLYEQELEDLKDELKQQKKEEKTNTESEYKKKVLNSKKPKSTIGKLSGVRGGRSRQVAGHSIKPKTRRRSASASPSVGRRVPSTTAGEEEGNLFGLLYEEFPYLYLSPDTWHELWRQGIQQIERITHSQQAARTRKNRGIAQLEEAESRQKILLGIMRKELAHNQRMREQKVKKQQELSVKNKLHEKRMQSARSRKYYNEYQVRSRAKMLKRRTKEEMVFKKLFQDGLEIQKERIKELRRYAKEQREIQSQQRQNDIDSLENYYRDQFEMLAESVARERQEQTTREKAQSKILDQMKKELRKKMEREIEDFQDQLFRDDDDVYFRQLDADRLRQELRVAKYNVKV